MIEAKVLEETKHVIHQCTGEVREAVFKDRSKLQQRWTVTTITMNSRGQIIGNETVDEWRDIPRVEL
jgi:hypothetical protein